METGLAGMQPARAGVDGNQMRIFGRELLYSERNFQIFDIKKFNSYIFSLFSIIFLSLFEYFKFNFFFRNKYFDMKNYLFKIEKKFSILKLHEHILVFLMGDF